MECPTTPEGKPAGLVSFRFARHYSGNRVCFLFLQLLRCLVPWVYLIYLMYSGIYTSPLRHVGCPIRKSSDITSTYDSPRHIGVSPVLHRLLVPRHSPCALAHLTIYFFLFNE